MLSLCLPFCLQQQAGIAEGKNIYIHAIFTFQPAFYIMYQMNWATCHQFASLVCVTGLQWQHTWACQGWRQEDGLVWVSLQVGHWKHQNPFWGSSQTPDCHSSLPVSYFSSRQRLLILPSVTLPGDIQQFAVGIINLTLSTVSLRINWKGWELSPQDDRSLFHHSWGPGNTTPPAEHLRDAPRRKTHFSTTVFTC